MKQNQLEIIRRREEVANAIRRIERESYIVPHTGDGDHERVEAFNASIVTESSFQQPLTDYACGFREPDVEAELEFWAPEVPVSRRFEYAQYSNIEEFLGGDELDERTSRSDFKDVEYTSQKIEAACRNYGLQVTLDMDQLQGRSDWEEFYVQKLLRRIRRNSIRRAVELLKAAATNTAKTWNSSADPDQDVITELVTCTDAAGITPNRVGYGPTAWAKRTLALRAQATAGAFAGATLDAAALAGLLNVEQVLPSKARYTTGASAKTATATNQVIMFSAFSGMDTEDASNIKRFVCSGAPEEGGGRYQVYSQRVSAKRHIIAVGHYELIKITSDIGIRKFTVS